MRQSWAFWYRTRRLEWEGEIGHLIIDQACLMDVQNHLGKTRKVCVGWVSDLLLSFAYLKMNFYVQYCQTNVHASAICNNSISLWVSRKGFQKCFCSSWPGWKLINLKPKLICIKDYPIFWFFNPNWNADSQNLPQWLQLEQIMASFLFWWF